MHAVVRTYSGKGSKRRAVVAPKTFCRRSVTTCSVFQKGALRARSGVTLVTEVRARARPPP